MHTPNFGGFPCLQAQNLLICDQPDPKDNFSPIKKYGILTHFDATAPLSGWKVWILRKMFEGSLAIWYDPAYKKWLEAPSLDETCFSWFNSNAMQAFERGF